MSTNDSPSLAGELLLLGLGGALVASAVRKAEGRAIASTRADVLRSVDMMTLRWRQRTGALASAATMVVGGLLVAHSLRRIVRGTPSSSVSPTPATDEDAGVP